MGELSNIIIIIINSCTCSLRNNNTLKSLNDLDNDTLKSFNDLDNQLRNYRLTNKQKFESQKTCVSDHSKRPKVKRNNETADLKKKTKEAQNENESLRAIIKKKSEFDQDNPDQDDTRKATEPKNRDLCHDKIRKTIKPKLSLQAEKRISELERTIKTIKQDNESLEAIMQIQQQNFSKALKDLEKENNESQRPWHVIKPKRTVSSENKLDKVNSNVKLSSQSL